MSISVGEAFLAIVPDMSRFKGDLSKQVEPALQSTSKRVGQTIKLCVAMTAGLTVPLVALGMKVLGVFQRLRKNRSANGRGDKNTGGAANVSADQVASLASSISSYSGIDDEAVQSGSNLLLTFTNIRNEAGKGNDVFNRDMNARRYVDGVRYRRFGFGWCS